MSRLFLGFFALIAALGALGPAAPAQTSATAPPARTVGEVIAGMQSFWQGLRTYQVPVTLTGTVHASILSVPFKAEGTEYYRAPNQQALHLDGAPSLAQNFQTTVASMGSPQTWPSNYTMTLKGTQTNHHHAAYVLVGTPKKTGGNVKTLAMWINARTFVVETVEFAYANGSTLDLDFVHHGHGQSPYHLPTSITVVAKFPSYSGNAQIVYGTYQTNGPLPSSAFEKQ